MDPDPTLGFYIKLSSEVKESHKDWCRKTFFKKIILMYISIKVSLKVYLEVYEKKYINFSVYKFAGLGRIWIRFSTLDPDPS